jgi:hypothetical protein
MHEKNGPGPLLMVPPGTLEKVLVEGSLSHLRPLHVLRRLQPNLGPKALVLRTAHEVRAHIARNENIDVAVNTGASDLGRSGHALQDTARAAILLGRVTLSESLDLISADKTSPTQPRQSRDLRALLLQEFLFENSEVGVNTRRRAEFQLLVGGRKRGAATLARSLRRFSQCQNPF